MHPNLGIVPIITSVGHWLHTNLLPQNSVGIAPSTEMDELDGFAFQAGGEVPTPQMDNHANSFSHKYKVYADSDNVVQSMRGLPLIEQVDDFMNPRSPLVIPPEFANVIISPEGIESYVSSYEWAEYDPVAHQTRWLPDCTNWSSFVEVVPVGEESVEIELSADLIFDADTTSVYAIESPSAWTDSVIKYQLFCGTGFDKSAPMLTEAFFLKLLEQQPDQITHKLRYMSGPFKAPFDDSEKFTKVAKTHCDAVDKDEEVPLYFDMIQYMITERMGQDLRAYAKDQFELSTFNDFGDNVANAFRLTAQMIRLLEKLHALNIIHGDAHWGNFVFDANHDLKIIDFGRARVIDPLAYKTAYDDNNHQDPRLEGFGEVQNDSNEANLQVHTYVSMWETYYALPSFRDDVFRVIQTLAFMLHGLDYTSMANLWSSPQHKDVKTAYYKYKHLDNIFETELICSYPEKGMDTLVRANFVLDDILPDHNLEASRRSLERILASVRNTKIYERPNYHGIIEELEKLIKWNDPRIPAAADIPELFRVSSTL